MEFEAFPVADDMIAAGEGVGWSEVAVAVRMVYSSDSARGRTRAAEPHGRYSGSDEIWPDREELEVRVRSSPVVEPASRPGKIHRGSSRCFCLESLQFPVLLSPVQPVFPVKSSLILFPPATDAEGAGTE